MEEDLAIMTTLMQWRIDNNMNALGTIAKTRNRKAILQLFRLIFIVPQNQFTSFIECNCYLVYSLQDLLNSLRKLRRKVNEMSHFLFLL